MDKFPSVTQPISLEQALQITREYLERISSILEATPGGPFEVGGIEWQISMPWNFRGTYFGASLLIGLFGSDEVTTKRVVVTPCTPSIYIEVADGRSATISLREGILTHEIDEKEVMV